MSISSEIERIIRAEFDPVHFELINDSDKHVGHAGHDGSGDSHFTLIVVSSSFDEVSRVQRSRMVYAVLDGLFSQGLHALSLKLSSTLDTNS